PGQRRQPDHLPAARVARRGTGSELATHIGPATMVRDLAAVPAARLGGSGPMGMPGNHPDRLINCASPDRNKTNHARRITMPATPANQDAVTLTAENLHGVPHGEVIAFTRDTDGPGASSVFFNTLGLPEEMTDEQFRALDPERLKAAYRADAIW